MVEYRERLKKLRQARNAVVGTHSRLTVNTWYHGEEVKFAELIGAANIKAHLAAMLDHEIAETVLSIETHGVVVDE